MVIENSIYDDYKWLPQDCPICGNSPTNFVGERGGDAHRAGLGVKCEVWSCANCSILFPHPMPHPIGGIEQHYEVEVGEFFINHEREFKLDTARIILEDGEKMLGRKGQLLDIGSGRGELLEVALKRGWKAKGVEPSKTFAAYAEKMTGTRIYSEPVEKCEIADDTYDLVVLGAVLEHLYNPNEVVATIARILKPGGIVFFDVPNEKGLIFIAGNLYQKIRGRRWCTNLAPTFAPYHVFGYSPRSIKLMFGKHGLDITKMHVYGGLSVLAARPGVMGKIEDVAATVMTKLSNIGSFGAYIAAWARKA